MADHFQKKAAQQLGYLHAYFYNNFTPVTGITMGRDERADTRTIPTAVQWRPVSLGTAWQGRDDYFWLQFPLTVLTLTEDAHYVLHAVLGRTGGGNNSGFEGLLFVNGAPYQAVDSNHEEVHFGTRYSGQTLSIAIKLWTGLEGGGPRQIQHYTLDDLSAGIINQSVVDCYAYLWNIVGTVAELGPDEPLRYSYQTLVKQSLRRFDWASLTPATIGPVCDQVLADIHAFIAAHPHEKKSYQITAVGQTHIDVAWLWRLRHTREKIARSFSTVLALMDEYPDYRFFMSTPQDFAFLADDYPDLYQRVAQRIAEGRWEVDGGTWLEPDVNMPSGESLTRQFLYGSAYFKQHFDADAHVLWLPDTFGYSAALPQIMHGFGVDNFMTTKISWNDTNRVPHDTFYWQGIDGSRVLTHFITTIEPWTNYEDPAQWQYTYNGDVTPHTVIGTYHVYADKPVNDHLLLAYGYGDGGGGPTREQIQNIRILNELPGMPTIHNGRVADFFSGLQDQLHHAAEPVAVWRGELYLEFHRGTYTSQARIKAHNRRAEYALRDLEMRYAAAHVEQGLPYPQETLHTLWTTLLRNQFHDILPGSAIHEVYADAEKEFSQLFATIAQLHRDLDAQVTTTAAGQSLVRNSLPWSTTQLIGGQEVTVPALSTISLPAAQPAAAPAMAVIDGRTVHTPFYDLTYAATGSVIKIWDKRAQRDVLADAGGNILTLYEDRPLQYDNWNIDADYPDKASVLQADQVAVTANTPLYTDITSQYAFGQSTMTQVIRLYAHNPRIDFRTTVDWHERQRLLRVAFNTPILATSARYDIQYGNVTRATDDNTSWDQAKFETVAHEWVDLAQRDYGVALLNDSKYGHRIKGSQISLSLLKSGNYPDTTADEGIQTFTYALLPHTGDFLTGQVPQAAAELNEPLRCTADRTAETLTPLFTVTGDYPAALDAVKISEDGTALIVRVHDYSGTDNRLSLTPRFAAKTAQTAALDEHVTDATELLAAGQVTLTLHPYEIRTIRFTW